MSLFDIIKTNEAKENRTSDGIEVLHHEGNAFSNHYLDGKSFDDLEKKVVDVETEKGIHFSVDFKLHPDAVKKLTSVGHQIQSNCCILQHNLVMYSFSYAITVVADEKKLGGLACRFRFIPIGNSYRYPTEMVKGGVPVTFSPDVPELKNVKWIFEDGRFLDLNREDDGTYECEYAIAIVSFENLTKDGVATLRVEMTIDKDYFEIGKYVDLNMKEAHVVPNSYKVLDKILMGEEVPKSDWVISAGEGFPRDFHVHGPVLANASLALRAAVSSHMSIGKEIAMISHENRFILPSLKSSDMRVLLTYIYHRRVIVPDFDAVSRIGKVLTLLFRDDMPTFFKFWDADIIKNIKTLDRSDTMKTISECVKALIRVLSAPQCALLGSYNVALIVAADAWQMAEGNGKKVKVEKVKKEIGESWPLIDSIIELIDDFKASVCGVEKMEYVE